jgi:hypothetical protein
MYLYYLYLWYNFLFYDGKAGWKGFEIFMMTIFTAPVYFIFHLSVFFISRQAKAKKVMVISLIGIVLCIVHVCAVLGLI